MSVLTQTHFQFPGQTQVYNGKVRDVYTIGTDLLVMIATDRLSAFDVVLPRGIPYKGQILNQIAVAMMETTQSIVPNWLIASPDPNVTIGRRCEPFKVEMVIRGYLSGHAARLYSKGARSLCDVPLPNGMQENDPFPQPVITPTTKAAKGSHDEDISRSAILESGLVSEADYVQLEAYTRTLFKKGTEIAAASELLLVDTKYEFGKTHDGAIVLMDEIHTPDSSRYFYAEGYQERQARGEPQQQLSKEFVRQWLIAQGFQGKEGQCIPEMGDDYIAGVSERYIELYEKLMGKPFVKADVSDMHSRIEKNVLDFLGRYKPPKKE